MYLHQRNLILVFTLYKASVYCVIYIPFLSALTLFTATSCTQAPSPGWFSHWPGIRICACPLGRFFAKFGIAIGEFSSETKEPKLHKLGVFWAYYCKKHPIWAKMGALLSKMVHWWVGNWYRESQIFEVWQAHPRTISVSVPPPMHRAWTVCKLVYMSEKNKETRAT